MLLFNLNVKAPIFSLKDYSDTLFSLYDTKDQWIIIFFYNNSSNTKERIFFADILGKIRNFSVENLMIYGISAEPIFNQFSIIQSFKNVFETNKIKLLNDYNYRVFYQYNHLLLKYHISNPNDIKQNGFISTFIVAPDFVVKCAYIGHDFFYSNKILKKIKELKFFFDFNQSEKEKNLKF